MTHWDIYNTFERLIFLIGYIAIWYVLVKLMVKACKAWDNNQAKKRAMRQKKGQKTINHIDWRG
jgi:hypothetical protein